MKDKFCIYCIFYFKRKYVFYINFTGELVFKNQLTYFHDKCKEMKNMKNFVVTVGFFQKKKFFGRHRSTEEQKLNKKDVNKTTLMVVLKLTIKIQNFGIFIMLSRNSTKN